MDVTTAEPAAEPVDIIEPPRLTSLSPEQEKERAVHIGGSEIACLFGCGYQTELELWLQKAEQLEKPELMGEHIEAGIFLEDGIARWAAYREGWKIRHVNRYIKHKTVAGWGSSLDYEIVGHPQGAAPLEIKNVNWFAGQKLWRLTLEDMEAPPHIELQLQHQIGATGRAWGAIAANVGGSLKTISREPNQRILDLMGEKIEKFWDSIQRGTPPEPNPDRDLETLLRLWPEAIVGKTVDLSQDPEFRTYVEALEQGKRWIKAGEAIVDAAKTSILWRIQDAEAALVGEMDGKPMVLAAPTRTRKGYVVQDTSYREIRLKELKEEKKPSRKALAAAAAE